MSNRRDSRVKIAPGIYRDHANWHATIHVRGAGNREKRFPLAQSITEVQNWRERTRAQLLEFAERGTVAGTFARDATRYLNAFTTHLVSAKARKIEIHAWVKEFGDRPRGTIKPADVAALRSKWLKAGKSPKTVNNRVDSLRHLYHALDGRRAWTPCDDLQKLHSHKHPIQRVSDETILAVDAELQRLEQLPAHAKKKIKSAKWRIWFRILVSTGRRPSEISRAEPGDVDFDRRVWLPRDGKGGFSPGIYLNDDMLSAWQLFNDNDLWGKPIDTFKLAARLRRAGWSATVRPYNARHTVGITLSEGGTDLDDVGAMLGHKRRETTRKHYVPVLNSRMQRASESLAGRFKGWPSVQTGVQTAKVTLGKSRPKLAHLKARTNRGKTKKTA